MEIREELAYINQFAKTELTEEQVYVFSVRLCDNEVDRDFERFDTTALERLGELFVGKSGIFDHQWSAKGQTARIYRTEVVREESMVTAAGDGYCWLIEGGIKKEVSVGCSMGRSVCSICGAENGACSHIRGETYDGRLCFTELRDPQDAYEWSFVAVPAQRNAGVLKHFGQNGDGSAMLEKQAALGRKYLAELRREVTRLAMLTDDGLDGKVFAKAVSRLDEPELQELKEAYEARMTKKFPSASQLRRKDAAEKSDETMFLV